MVRQLYDPGAVMLKSVYDCWRKSGRSDQAAPLNAYSITKREALEPVNGCET